MTPKSKLLAVAIVPLLFAASADAAGPAGAPLPGGKYRGEVRDQRLTVKTTRRVDSSVASGAGKLTIRCAAGRTRRVRFSTRADGTFRARKTRGGRTIIRVRGAFRGIERVRGRIARVRGRHCGRGRFNARLARPRGLEKHVVTYGPYSTEPSMGMHAGGLRAPARLRARSTGTAQVGDNVINFGVQKPCTDCYVVGMIPDLVGAGGESLNFDDQAMLHHIVFSNQAATDPTCGNGWPLGQRFFASGNERTPFVLPRGYGYRVRPGDSWTTIAHLMNMSSQTRDLYVEITFYTLPAGTATTGVTPFWLDIDNCADSEYPIPAGRSTESRDFQVTPQWAGKVIALGGHLHDGGVSIEAVRRRSGRVLCSSRAGYGKDPSYMGHVETLSGCAGNLGRLVAGDVVRLDSTYDRPSPQDDVMGIMVGYSAPR